MIMLSVMWVMTAAMVGFSLGRVSMYRQAVCEEGPSEGQADVLKRSEVKAGNGDSHENVWEEEDRPGSGAGRQAGQAGENTHVPGFGRRNHSGGTGRRPLLRGKGRRGEEEHAFWSVGSPVSGEVTAQREGEQPTVIIRPDGDRLYAPAGGKVTRIFPMGNAFLFTTEFGAELYIQAGEADDELMVRHYRPRILQNEVVGKGKLLLEFDRTGLEAEGFSTEVSISVENTPCGGDVRMTVGERVKTGEEILQVMEA